MRPGVSDAKKGEDVLRGQSCVFNPRANGTKFTPFDPIPFVLVCLLYSVAH